MTRGNFVVIKDGKIYMSIQFNGDMYPSGNGKYVYHALRKVTDINTLRNAIKKFDQEHFGYGQEDGEYAYDLNMEHDLNFGRDYFKRFNSDYLYIKNLDDEDFEITERDSGKKFSIKPNEIQIWNYGRFSPVQNHLEDMQIEDEVTEKYYPEGDPVSKLIGTIMDKLDMELQTALRNMYQKEMSTPFQNSGEKYENDTFSAKAYDWNENAEPNFKYQGIRVWWYKHSGRGLCVRSDEDITLEMLTKMNDECIDSIKNDKELKMSSI